jgi:hypothetical protein
LDLSEECPSTGLCGWGRCRRGSGRATAASAWWRGRGWRGWRGHLDDGDADESWTLSLVELILIGPGKSSAPCWIKFFDDLLCTPQTNQPDRNMAMNSSASSFKNIEPIPNGTDFLDIVLSRTQRRLPTVIRPGFKISRIRAFYARKVKYTQESFTEKLDAILTQFPRLDAIHPFHADLVWLVGDLVNC